MIDTSKKYLDILRAVGEGDGAISDIAQVSLILASLDRPGVSFQKYQHHLKILALDVSGAKIKSESASSRAKALSEILHKRHEYSGNEDFYEDLQNANLMSVIDTRKGLPVALGILYIHAARSQGWFVEGINFPRHFLIRLYGHDTVGDGAVIIDPFNGGKILNARELRKLIQKSLSSTATLMPEYYMAISDREILVRLLNTIKVTCLKVSDMGQAIRILERLILINPQHLQHHYEMGMLLAHVGKNEPAREVLSYCLEHIEKLQQNELIEQQIINTLKDIDKQDQKKQTSNVLKLYE